MSKFVWVYIQVNQGINPCIDVPEKFSNEFGIRGNIPVLGNLNGHEIRSTLVPIGRGRHRLYVNTDMRSRAGLEVGVLIVSKNYKSMWEWDDATAYWQDDMYVIVLD